MRLNLVSTWRNIRPVVTTRRARLGGIIENMRWLALIAAALQRYGYMASKLMTDIYQAWLRGRTTCSADTAYSYARQYKKGVDIGVPSSALYAAFLFMVGVVGGPYFHSRVSRAVADEALMKYLCQYPARSATEVMAREKLISVIRPDGSELHVTRWAEVNRVYGASDDVIRKAEGYYYAKYMKTPPRAVIPRGYEHMYTKAVPSPRLFDTYKELIEWYRLNPDKEVPRPVEASERIRRWCFQNVEGRRSLIQMVKQFPKIQTIVWIPMPDEAEVVINFLIDNVNTWISSKWRIPRVKTGVPVIKIPCWNYCTKPPKGGIPWTGAGYCINPDNYIWALGTPTRAADKVPATPTEIKAWCEEAKNYSGICAAVGASPPPPAPPGNGGNGGGGPPARPPVRIGYTPKRYIPRSYRQNRR